MQQSANPIGLWAEELVVVRGNVCDVRYIFKLSIYEMSSYSRTDEIRFALVVSSPHLNPYS